MIIAKNPADRFQLNILGLLQSPAKLNIASLMIPTGFVKQGCSRVVG
jgi:hypothetical protein